MIFRRIHVDGFGIWHDLTLDDLSPGLNVFVAPNEGGKSTLMSFLRAVLFGFKRRDNPRRYEPLRGGVHGGHIELEADGASYTVKRTDDGTSSGRLEVLGPDGEKLETAVLSRLLANTTDTLYENVFAFGLDELQNLATLQDQEVAGHIYSAGMASGGISPMEFRQRLTGRMEELWLPRGRKQTIPTLIQEIEDLQAKIDALQDRPEHHAELVVRRDRLEARLEELDRSLVEHQEAVARARRAQRAWPHYQEMLEAEAALRSIGVSLQDALERVRADVPAAQLEAEIAAAEADDEEADLASVPTYRRAEAAEAGAEHGGGGSGGSGGGGSDGGAATGREAGSGRRTSVIESIDANALLPASQRSLFHHAGRIRSLHTGIPRLAELHALVLRNRKEADQNDTTLGSFLKDLGEGWTRERLRTTSTEIALRESIRSQEENMRRCAAHVEALAGRADDAHETYEDVAGRAEPISRETVFLTWILVAGAGLAFATLTPSWARIPVTVSVLAVGITAGILVSWLRSRGRQQRHEERAEAAEREASLWKQHDEAQIELEESVERWEAWLREHGLPASLTPEGALDLLERAREAQDLDRQVRESRERAEEAEEQLRAGCDRIATLLDELERDVRADLDDPLSALEPLSQELEAVHLELQEAERDRDRLRTVLDRYVQARAALRAIAGDEGLDDLRRRLDQFDPDKLDQLIADAEEAHREARRERDAASQESGAVGEQLAAIERDEELAELLQAREARRAELAEAVEEWAGHALGVALFDEAKLRYEAERQPEVLKSASRYLEAMTAGRYVRVLAPLGEDRIEVERARTGKRLRPEQLSRGTSEQLYLAMRLALATVYAVESVSLPIVADDILVNFDDERAAAAARVLGEFADEGHQVLAFTCHQHLAQTFSRNCADARLRPLPAHT